MSRQDLGFLCRPQRFVSDLVFPLLPHWVTPVQVTAAGFCFALVAAVALFFSSSWRWLLGVAAVALCAHPIADALDGDVARTRGTGSPRGIFLDFFLDDVSFVAIYLGIAFSGRAIPELVLLGAIVHLLSDILANLRIQFLKEHIVPAFSPTEIAAAMAVACLLTLWLDGPLVSVAGRSLTLFDLGFIPGVAWGTLDLIVAAGRMCAQLKGPGE